MSVSALSLAQHMAELRARMQHPTDYEKALDYFMSTIANAFEMHQLGEPTESPALRAVLSTALQQVFGKPHPLQALAVLHAAEHGLYHGCARTSGRAIAFFYCRRLNIGIVGAVPGLKGTIEVVRFRLQQSLHPERDN
jgi:hypothetical protein